MTDALFFFSLKYSKRSREDMACFVHEYFQVVSGTEGANIFSR